ncbi:MAG: hypothetical protein LBR80_11595 [Deltaproteobacteria bacterium]|nr:hypothetical protein [Deltaproteobacteria bacterium]
MLQLDRRATVILSVDDCDALLREDSGHEVERLHGGEARLFFEQHDKGVEVQDQLVRRLGQFAWSDTVEATLPVGNSGIKFCQVGIFGIPDVAMALFRASRKRAVTLKMIDPLAIFLMNDCIRMDSIMHTKQSNLGSF